MTRLMYDSITAADIPANAQIVGGYVNGTFKWSDADWARFPNAVHVRFATRAYVNDGCVLDVERGDATPAEAPGWVTMRRAAGCDPSVYCNASDWPAVRAAFSSAGVAEPHYMIAHYDNIATIPVGAVAKQYINDPASGGHYDLSVVADYWPGVDTPSQNRGFTDMSDAYPTPKVLADGSYRYHVSLSNWDKVNGRYVALSTGFSGCEFEVWIQLANGGYVSSPDQIPSGSYGKVLKGTLAPDNVHWLGVPSGAQSVSVQVRPSTADGVPGVTVFTDGK